MWNQHFQDRGYVQIPAAVPDAELARLRRELDAVAADAAGTRNLMRHDGCRRFVPLLRDRLRRIGLLADDAVAIQCSLFRKTRARNWRVALHQDLAVPVAESVDDPALSGWSEKEGGLFVQAPADMLGDMVIVRLHLDPCGADDGPLRVVPGSHRAGRLDGDQALVLREQRGEVDCLAEPGDLLVMRPLLLHASSKARRPGGMRRMLHFLFASASPACGLRWSIAV